MRAIRLLFVWDVRKHLAVFAAGLLFGVVIVRDIQSVIFFGALFLLVSLAIRMSGQVLLKWMITRYRINNNLAKAQEFEGLLLTPEGRQKCGLLGMAAIFCGCILLLSIVLAVIGVVMGPKIGENVSPGECPYNIPPEAKNICYFYPRDFSPFSAVEFDIDEEGFRNYAAKRDITLKEILGEPVIIQRYNIYNNVNLDERKVVIKNGLYDSWHEKDKGRYMAYNRERGRAYFFYHSR